MRLLGMDGPLGTTMRIKVGRCPRRRTGMIEAMTEAEVKEAVTAAAADVAGSRTSFLSWMRWCPPRAKCACAAIEEGEVR